MRKVDSYAMSVLRFAGKVADDIGVWMFGAVYVAWIVMVIMNV